MAAFVYLTPDKTSRGQSRESRRVVTRREDRSRKKFDVKIGSRFIRKMEKVNMLYR